MGIFRRVVVADDLSTGSSAFVPVDLLVRANILDTDLIARILEEHAVGAVMHFAAFSQVGESTRNPGLYWRNNVVGAIKDLPVEQNTDGVVTFATQSAGCEAAGALAGRPLLLFHGDRDELLPESRALHDWAAREFLGLAPDIGVPVRSSLGEYERVWRNDPAEMVAVGGLAGVVMFYWTDMFPEWGSMKRFFGFAALVILGYKGPELYLANVASKRNSDPNLIVATSTVGVTQIAQGKYPGGVDTMRWLAMLGADVGVPGPNSLCTPLASSAWMSSSGMMPPPITRT